MSLGLSIRIVRQSSGVHGIHLDAHWYMLINSHTRVWRTSARKRRYSVCTLIIVCRSLITSPEHRVTATRVDGSAVRRVIGRALGGENGYDSGRNADKNQSGGRGL